jgi:hypothetical protein
MSRITDLVNKRHSFTWKNILRFLGRFLISYIVYSIPLLLTIWIRESKISKFLPYEWYILGFGPVPLVVFAYVQEYFRTKKNEETIQENKIIYDCIGGAIDLLIEYKSRSQPDLNNYISDLLKYTEKIVSLVLKSNGIEQGTLCVNLMIKTDSTLDLAYFSMFMHGRERRQLIINPEELLPGAPEACYYNKTTYIPNILSRKYKRYFDKKKPYRSIISIPISGLHNIVYAIMNIDSDQPNQFQSQDFINKKILPSISPVISLMQLEHDLIRIPG